MIATKEQERKALAKIRKIVEELGEDSYIGTALEGCLDIAEDNINNDWACSMKQRWETSEREAAEALRKVEDLEQRNDFLRTKLDMVEEEMTAKADARIAELAKKVKELEDQVLPAETLRLMKDMLSTKYDETEIELHEAVNEVIRLADNPDTDEFRAAVRRQRTGAEILDMLEKNCEIVSERLFRLGLS